MHEHETSCRTLEKVRDAISDELNDLFRKPNSGIQNSFELMFGIIKEQEERYKADHERLREENKMLIENMKCLQESNLSILEALNKKEVSLSKLEDVMVEIKKLHSGVQELEKDQIQSKELLKQLSNNMKVLEFQLQLESNVNVAPVSDVKHGCISKETDVTSSETNLINCDASRPDCLSEVVLDDVALSTNAENNKFSHKSQSHKALVGRLTLLEHVQDKMNYDLDYLKAELKKMTVANMPHESNVEHDVQEEIIKSDLLATNKETYAVRNINRQVSPNRTELHTEVEIETDVNFPSDPSLQEVVSSSGNFVKHAGAHNSYEMTANDSVFYEQEERLDPKILYIISRIDCIEQNYRQLKEQSDSITKSIEIFQAGIGIYNTVDIEISSIKEKLSTVEMSVISMVSKDDLNSKIDDYFTKNDSNLRIRMKSQNDSDVQHQSQIEGKLESLEKYKLDKVSFQEALRDTQVSLYNKIHDEISELNYATEQKMISIQNDFNEYRKNIVDLQFQPTSLNGTSEMDSQLNDAIKDTKDSTNATVENHFLRRFEGLNALEDEIEKISTKLATVPDRNQINDMLQELESSVLKNVEQDQSSKSIIDGLKKEINDKISKVEVLKIIKDSVYAAKNGSHSDSTNLSLMAGYKCLCCKELHPMGIHRYVARKVNHDALPNAKTLCQNSSLSGQPGLEYLRTRPSTTESSSRLPLLTKQQQRPSTASFLSIGDRRSRRRVSSAIG